MRRQVIPDGWYGEALPSGEWCALVPHDRIYTHLGDVPLPPGEGFGPGFLRCTAVDGFRMAGQAHDTIEPACWEWVATSAGGTWIPYPQPCVGVNPVIYDRAGRLLRSDGAVGSQGYRYVTTGNQVISGDQTYGPFNGLYEYTALDSPGLWVGQGATDGSGIRVWDGQTLRQVESGTGRFLRARQNGSQIALAFANADGLVLLWLTEAELRAFPPAVDPSPPVAFRFTHPVLVRPFKAEGSGVPDLFTLGTYTEAEALPNPLPPGRLLVGHDSLLDWDLPADRLRPFDVPLIEYYRDPLESLAASVARWTRQTDQLLARWPGACGVIPMFYTQFRWTTAQILGGLAALSGLVNRSPRIKVIAPFAYNRANGIISDPVLQQAFRDLVAAADLAGAASLPSDTPIDPPEKEKDPPMPKSQDQIRADITELIRFYNEPDGLNRAARGIPSPVDIHDPAIFDWVALAVITPIEEVKRRIRTFPEYLAQHPNPQ